MAHEDDNDTNLIRTFVTVPNNLSKRLEELEMRIRLEIVHITTLLRSDRLLRRVLENQRNLQ